MSLLRFIKAQLGLSNTPANNFTLDASADNGTMKLARGNAGATTQDIVTIDASGVVDHPQGLKIAGAAGQRMLLTASQATTAGTAIDFTGIPSWAKKITVMFNGVSTNGTSNYQVQAGTSGGVVTSGYLGSSADGPTLAATSFTTGFGIRTGSAAAVLHGAMQILNISGNGWTASGGLARSDIAVFSSTAGSVTLSGTLDRIRLTTVNGTDTFDAGSVSLLIEGY